MAFAESTWQGKNSSAVSFERCFASFNSFWLSRCLSQNPSELNISRSRPGPLVGGRGTELATAKVPGNNEALGRLPENLERWWAYTHRILDWSNSEFLFYFYIFFSNVSLPCQHTIPKVNFLN